MNPLIVDGVFYGVTPTLQAFALDAATGEQLWVFGNTLRHWSGTSRGGAYWSDGQDKRIFYTNGSDLWANMQQPDNLVAILGKMEKLICIPAFPKSHKTNS